jgi:hypothetical protein
VVIALRKRPSRSFGEIASYIFLNIELNGGLLGSGQLTLLFCHVLWKSTAKVQAPSGANAPTFGVYLGRILKNRKHNPSTNCIIGTMAIIESQNNNIESHNVDYDLH